MINRYDRPWWADSCRTDEREFTVYLTGEDALLASTGTNLAFVAKHPNCMEAKLRVTGDTAWQLYLELIDTVTRADVFVLPGPQGRTRLLQCDMDSTIIDSESLDELAATTGLGKEVASITEQAMRGDIDFYQAFCERIKLLKGLDMNTCTDITATLRANAGARELIQAASMAGIRTLLVSGGIEPIVQEVAGRLGFDQYFCNRVGIQQGRLTGEIIPPVIDGSGKLQILTDQCCRLGIAKEHTCAIGDGANDLPMLRAAGLGIAYKAKPQLRETICHRIQHSSLETVIDLLGLR